MFQKSNFKKKRKKISASNPSTLSRNSYLQTPTRALLERQGKKLCHWNHHFARPFSSIQPHKSCGKTSESVCRGTRESNGRKKEGRNARTQGPCIAWRMEQKWRKPATQRAKQQEETGGSSGWVWAREVGPCVQCQVARIFSPVLRCFVLLRTLCLYALTKKLQLARVDLS